MSPLERRLRQPWWLFVLVTTFMVNLVVSNLRVAWDVVTPRLRLHPAVLRVPIRPQLGDVGIVVFANLISVTPGTLTLEVDETERVLYVHFMYPGRTREEALAELDELQLRLVAGLYATPVSEVDLAADRQPDRTGRP